MSSRFRRSPIAIAAFLVAGGAFAQQSADTAVSTPEQTLGTIVVNASADASAEGLSKPYAGGQVARGGRIGILGTQDNMDVPFNVTSYTNELIQDQQARTIGDVLKNDASVRVARGFGNFQDAYFIRGFILQSDEVAYNGLYGILPRQLIATELVERVEVLRGASAFLNGAAPGGGAIGGSINLVPKRAGNEPLTRVTVGEATGGQYRVSTDIARRFGPDQSAGVRINAVRGNGGTGVDKENVDTSVLSIGADWHSRDVRLSADLGFQDNRLKRTRPSVTLDTALTSVPSLPNSDDNWAQNWTYSNERDKFATLRGEYDITSDMTAWAAVGIRKSKEASSLAGITVTDANLGDGTTYRADTRREDTAKSGEIGLRWKVRTGDIGHSIVASASTYRLDKKAAYAWSDSLPTNLYNPIFYPSPPPNGSASYLVGGDLEHPGMTGRTRLDSVAIGDTLSFMDDRVLVTLGIRHQSIDDRSYDYNTGAESNSYDKSNNSPFAGVVWKLRKDLSAYVNYIESLSKGEDAPGTAINKTAILSPYVSKQKEIGLKYDGGRIGGAIAFFTTEKPSGLIDSGYFREGGKDRHQGVELSVYGEAAKGLRILGGVTFLDAKQRETEGGTNDGNRVIGVPKVQGNIGVEWDVPGIQGFSLDSQIVATGSSYADEDNTQRVPGWARLDLGARYMMEVNGKLLTLRARVDNVTDRDYWASVGGYPGNGYLTEGAPRTFTVSASMDF